MVISFPDDPSDLPDFVSLKRLALSGMDIHYMLNDEERRIRSYLKKCPNLEELDLVDSKVGGPSGSFGMHRQQRLGAQTTVSCFDAKSRSERSKRSRPRLRSAGADYASLFTVC